MNSLFENAKDRFGAVSGGYTRVLKVGRRAGDAARMSIIELIGSDSKKPKRKKKADNSSLVIDDYQNSLIEKKGAEASIKDS